jgi:hypothetical protein
LNSIVKTDTGASFFGKRTLSSTSSTAIAPYVQHSFTKLSDVDCSEPTPEKPSL